MRTWVKGTIVAVALAAACFAALAGVAGYFVFRSLERRSTTEVAAFREIDAIRTRFGGRPPLVEIIDPRTIDVRINRLAGPEGARVSMIRVVNWKAEDGEITRVEMPLWLMRFSSVNILSQLSVTPAKVRLTVEDIQRYGPGVVVDYSQPGAVRLLVWVD